MRRAPDERAFAAALQRRSRESFARFVADLWRARGAVVDRNGAVLTVRDGTTTRTLVVTHDPSDAADAGRRPSESSGSNRPPVTVVTSRRVDGDVVDVVDADELLQIVRYAVDREQASALLDRHLGDGASAFCSGHRSTPDAGFDVTFGGVTRRRTIAALVVLASLVFLASVVGVFGGGPLDTATLSPFDREPEATTGVSTTDSATATRTVTERYTPVDYAALDCPRPPADVHPARLRPGVVPGASSSGLDGWRLLSASNVTTFAERTALGLPTEPVVRHVARYQSPDGATFDLTLDQWASGRTAETVAPALAADSDATIRWGVYTVSVRAYDRNGTRLESGAQTGRVELLLSYVHRPSGIRLGDLCVRSLLADR